MIVMTQLWEFLRSSCSMIFSEKIVSLTTLFDTIDDLHWKTDRQAASLI